MQLHTLSGVALLLFWVQASSSPRPAGANGHIQFNKDGVMGGAAVGLGLRLQRGILEVNEAVPTFLTFSTSLDFPALAQNACADLDLPAPGAMVGDAVSAGYPQNLAPGLTGTLFVSQRNQITARLCKVTPGTVDLPPSMFRATIVRSF